ncbi:MAG: ATP-binding protein [Dorea sp.]
MALSNSQYDQIMRTYEQRQLDNERQLRRHYETAYARTPEIQELDDTISSLSIRQAQLLLEGDESALSNLKTELSHLIRKKKTLLTANGYPEDYLTLHYHCPDCRDTGYIGTDKCHCFKKAIVDLLYTQSNLQEILEKENFSTCCLDFYSSNHIDSLTGRSSRESIQIALKACHEFIDTFSTEFRNILLYGDTGVGKTFLSNCIAKELIESSYSVIYFSAAQLFEYFAKNTFGKKEEQDADALEHIYDCDLLIIDDLGTELSNSFTMSQLFICLNERILRRKSTIISTNLALENIKSIYSERIFSRISSNYSMLRLTGDDIRIQKKLLNLGGTNDVTP